MTEREIIKAQEIHLQKKFAFKFSTKEFFFLNIGNRQRTYGGNSGM